MLIDEPVTLRVEAASGRAARISAASVDTEGVTHISWALYEADREGSVDPTRHAPVAGTYEGIDPFGMWWSTFTHGINPVPTAVFVEVNDKKLTTLQYERLRVAPEVSVEPIYEYGVRHDASS